MTEEEGESDRKVVRRIRDAVGIISKHSLYPAAQTEGPVCVFLCVLLGRFCTCCTGNYSFNTKTEQKTLMSHKVSQPMVGAPLLVAQFKGGVESFLFV